jgi:hypothetical protein
MRKSAVSKDRGGRLCEGMDAGRGAIPKPRHVSDTSRSTRAITKFTYPGTVVLYNRSLAQIGSDCYSLQAQRGRHKNKLKVPGS